MKTGIIAASALGVGLFLIAGLLGQSVAADRGWGGPRGGPDSQMAGFGGPGAQFMFEALDLTPEQRDMVDGILESYRPQFKALRVSGRESRPMRASEASRRSRGASAVISGGG